MPLPRGRKSLPTMFSRTEDLPADWDPTTTLGTALAFRDRILLQKPQLGSHNLWKVEGVAADGVEDQVLQLVDSGEQILAERSHGYGAARFSESKAVFEEVECVRVVGSDLAVPGRASGQETIGVVVGTRLEEGVNLEEFMRPVMFGWSPRSNPKKHQQQQARAEPEQRVGGQGGCLLWLRPVAAQHSTVCAATRGTLRVAKPVSGPPATLTAGFDATAR